MTSGPEALVLKTRTARILFEPVPDQSSTTEQGVVAGQTLIEVREDRQATQAALTVAPCGSPTRIFR